MIEQLANKIITANEAYRKGNPIISDKEYDILVDELMEMDYHHPVLTEVGHVVTDMSRKGKLPIEMASMNKTKTIEDIQDWLRLKEISQSTVVVLTPKYDGLSLCVDERNYLAWTRGDGEYGQKSNEHYKHIQNRLYDNLEGSFDPFSPLLFSHTYGEVIIPKKVFLDKYAVDYANPRNLVAGLFNGDEKPSQSKVEMLKDVQYIKYGAVTLNEKELRFKSDILSLLNDGQEEKVPFELVSVGDLTHELLLDCFKKWSEDYEIDGVIIEVNDLELQEELGRERSTKNPVWARAYKAAEFEQSAETHITSITWNISKQGYLKPILHIEPVQLDGVTVSNVTGNNARFVKTMGLGKGAKVVVKRSGMVIPIIYDVLEGVEFEMPDVPDIDWNDNGVELMTLTETDQQRFKQAVSFFEILDVDSVREGVIRQLWDAGFDSIDAILKMELNDFQGLDGFGERKSSIVYDAIQKKIVDVELSKLQHATGFFQGLGSKKLKLLEHFDTKPSVADVVEIEGFAETSAQVFVDNYDRFFDYLKTIPVTVTVTEEVVLESSDLDGKQFVFTGVRRKDLEEVILSKGGKVGSSVSKKTTHLVMKVKGSGSSKETKALKFGCDILEVHELEEMLN